MSQATGAAAWYRGLEERLAASDQVVKVVLVLVAVLALSLAFFQPSRTARAAGALWFILP